MANNAETSPHRPVLLLTRPAVSAARFATRLRVDVVSQADLIISPLLEIEPTHIQVDLTDCRGVIFSSVNGVVHGPNGNGLPAYCVGSETAKAADAKGWVSKLAALDAGDLVNRLPRSVPAPLVHLSGTVQRGDIAERLTIRGVPTRRMEVYAQKERALSAEAQAALSAESRVILPLFSPRSASCFARQAKVVRAVDAIAMSPAVAEELDGILLDRLHVLAQPVGSQMVRAVELLLSRDSLP